MTILLGLAAVAVNLDLQSLDPPGARRLAGPGPKGRLADPASDSGSHSQAAGAPRRIPSAGLFRVEPLVLSRSSSVSQAERRPDVLGAASIQNSSAG